MNTMEAVKAIGALMTEKGWDQNGSAGAVKRDADGKIVARHGSEQYIRDFDDARDTLAARDALAEMKRRGSA